MPQQRAGKKGWLAPLTLAFFPPLESYLFRKEKARGKPALLWLSVIAQAYVGGRRDAGSRERCYQRPTGRALEQGPAGLFKGPAAQGSPEHQALEFTRCIGILPAVRRA